MSIEQNQTQISNLKIKIHRERNQTIDFRLSNKKQNQTSIELYRKI